MNLPEFLGFLVQVALCIAGWELGMKYVGNSVIAYVMALVGAGVLPIVLAGMAKEPN